LSVRVVTAEDASYKRTVTSSGNLAVLFTLLTYFVLGKITYSSTLNLQLLNLAVLRGTSDLQGYENEWYIVEVKCLIELAGFR